MHRDGIVVTESKDIDLVVIGSCGAPVAVAVGGGGTNQYDTGSGSGYVEYVELNVNGSYRLVLCRFLKIRNHESQFYLLFSERRNCDSRNDSFSIHFYDSFGQRFRNRFQKKGKKRVKELELRFFWNRNRHSPLTGNSRRWSAPPNNPRS